jgi:hypothetical protein
MMDDVIGRIEKCGDCRWFEVPQRWLPGYTVYQDLYELAHAARRRRVADREPSNESPDLSAGECHRYPPSQHPEVRDQDRASAFTIVYDDDWCGEFQVAPVIGDP